MSTATRYTIPAMNYLTNGHTVKSWLLTKDHKRIALMYLVTVTAFFFIGGIAALALKRMRTTVAKDALQ